MTDWLHRNELIEAQISTALALEKYRPGHPLIERLWSCTATLDGTASPCVHRRCSAACYFGERRQLRQDFLNALAKQLELGSDWGHAAVEFFLPVEALPGALYVMELAGERTDVINRMTGSLAGRREGVSVTGTLGVDIELSDDPVWLLVLRTIISVPLNLAGKETIVPDLAVALKARFWGDEWTSWEHWDALRPVPRVSQHGPAAPAFDFSEALTAEYACWLDKNPTQDQLVVIAPTSSASAKTELLH